MNNKKLKLFMMLLAVVLGKGGLMAADVAIPTANGSYFDWNNASISNGNVENDGANIGSTNSSTVATFTVSNSTQQDYVLTFTTAANGLTGELNVVLTNSSSETVFSKVAAIENTGSWYLNETATVHRYLVRQLPAGTYSLTFSTKSTTGSYAGNWGKLAFYAADNYDQVPGTLTLSKGTYHGPRLENDDTNVGYIQNNGTATYDMINTSAGVYQMTMDIYRYNQGGTMNIKIADAETRVTEIDYDYTIAPDAPGAYTSNSIQLPGMLTEGLKTMTLSFSNGNSYICNYKAPTFSKVYDHIASVSSVAIDGQTVTTGESSDWYCVLPVSYGATTTFSISKENATVAVSAKDVNNTDVPVTDNGNGTYTITTPAMSTTTTVTMTLTAAEGSYAPQAIYTFKIFRIGEMSLTSITIDGQAVDVLDAINASPYTATYGGCYTTVPTVAATQIDGEVGTISEPSISGSSYTYTIHGSMAGGDVARDYTLILNNVHVYVPTGSETLVDMKANGGTIENNTWTNGIYSLATTSLDSYNQYFKMNGNSYTISVPSDVVVKQIVMKDASNNYAGNDARLTAVTSEGATAYIPVDNKYYHSSEGAQHDIIVNIDNHTAGTDIVLTQQKLGQPMAWIQLTTVKQNPGTAPQKTAERVTVVNNHAVVAVTFDREIANNVTATINGSTVVAEGRASVLYFPVWNLDYSTDYTLTIPAGAATDSYGNSTSEAINIAVNTDAKPAVEKSAYDYVVSNATELDAALEALKSTNNTANAVRKTVFLKNGNYTYGTLEGAYQYNVSLKIDNWNNVYNVSLIGESKDGVVIEGTTDGITSSTLNLGNGTGIYVQDMTIRNNYDFPTANKGVSVAVTGGNKAVLKNVAMQACQDTYVTGQRTYLENCDIYGTVDFICGGGDIFFNQCDLLLLYRQENKRDVIVAPNTTADTKWGYVLQGCTIKAMEGDNTLAEKNYTLGRDWQNEPRAYYLNTIMELLPADEGWENMGGAKPTHFYEYGSVDKNGNLLDLTSRQAPSHSTNLPYTPVLTAAEAAEFTVENVLGGTDSWLPTDETVMVAAPVISISDNALLWNDDTEARCYVVFKDGAYYAQTTEDSYTLTETGVYTVRAANMNGGLGEASNAVSVAAILTTGTTGWATGCFSSAVKIPESAKAYYVSNVAKRGDEALMKLTALTEVPAEAGFIFNAVEGTYCLEAADEPAHIINMLGGTLSMASVSDLCSDGIYTLAVVDESNNVGFKPYSPATLAAHKAYLPKTAIPTNARILRFTFDENTTTGISSIVNCQLSITDDAPAYNLAGQKVDNTYRGIIIRNGKRVVVK